MDVNDYAIILLAFGVLLLTTAVGLYVSTAGFPEVPETKVLFPKQLAQIKSDTIEGSLMIPFNVTSEGHVYADVEPDPHGYAFTLYSWHFTTSNGQRTDEFVLKPGTYYLAIPFKLDQGLSLPYDVGVGIYEEIEVVNPRFPYGIACFVTGAACLATSVYIPIKHKRNSTPQLVVVSYSERTVLMSQ
jgi:hypothetical protein